MGRLLTIELAIIYKHSEVALPMLKDHYQRTRQILVSAASVVCKTSLSKHFPRRYAIYLMKLVEFDGLLKMSSEDIFSGLLLLFKKMDAKVPENVYERGFQ
jgi:hypothetical protein